MTDSQFLIKKALQMSIEGNRLFRESDKVGENVQLKDKLISKARGFHARAKKLYFQAQKV